MAQSSKSAYKDKMCCVCITRHRTNVPAIGKFGVHYLDIDITTMKPIPGKAYKFDKIDQYDIYQTFCTECLDILTCSYIDRTGQPYIRYAFEIAPNKYIATVVFECGETSPHYNSLFLKLCRENFCEEAWSKYEEMYPLKKSSSYISIDKLYDARKINYIEYLNSIDKKPMTITTLKKSDKTNEDYIHIMSEFEEYLSSRSSIPFRESVHRAINDFLKWKEGAREYP